uniref:Uncharacterized protein n=1 Tax=Poncirus trifoliata TaxID=37690 RepID=Q8H6R1_PONTR|nr:hypothetical protein [Citrus trifoliata]
MTRHIVLKAKEGWEKKTGHLAPGVGWFMGRFEHGAVIDLDFTLNKIETLQAAMVTALQMVQLLELNSWYAFYLFAQLRFRST